MKVKPFLKKLKTQTESELKLLGFRINNFKKKQFQCSICNYNGPFIDVSLTTGALVKHEKCPRCQSWARHRLQKLVLDKLFKKYDPSTRSILHFAPEPAFKNSFKSLFKTYVSADLMMKGVDVKCDITSLPFEDKKFDFIVACHVMEHIKDDLKGLSELKRVLKPQGIAILAVPILSQKTIEYPEPNPNEWNHVRCPGEDYFDRYYNFFSSVEKYFSADFPEKYQLFNYEDRSIFPNEQCPMRPGTKGEKHKDIIPVCYV